MRNKLYGHLLPNFPSLEIKPNSLTVRLFHLAPVTKPLCLPSPSLSVHSCQELTLPAWQGAQSGRPHPEPGQEQELLTALPHTVSPHGCSVLSPRPQLTGSGWGMWVVLSLSKSFPCPASPSSPELDPRTSWSTFGPPCRLPASIDSCLCSRITLTLVVFGP